MLQFKDPATVTAAVGSLAMIGRPAETCVPDLEALAARSTLSLQLACAEALCCLTGQQERGLPLLLKLLEHPDPLLRKTAAERIAGLGETGHPAIPDLLRRAVDPDEGVRAAALLTLGRIRAPHSQIISDVTERLTDTSPEVRYTAAVVLSSYGGDAGPALTALRLCLRDPEEKVANCAAGAIQMIEAPA